MSRVISEAVFQKALKDGKVDARGTREARRNDRSASLDPEADHPLLAQGRAMQAVAMHLGDQGRAMEDAVRELGAALKSQGGEVAAAVKLLSSLVEQNNALIRQMALNMAAMHKSQQAKPQTQAEPQQRRPVKLKINRNASGFTESIDVIPS